MVLRFGAASPGAAWVLCLCLCLGGLGAPVARAGDASKRPFSAKERAQLKAGELVTRPTREQRGSLDLIGGASWQVIRRSPDAVWEGLQDTSRYHRWMPQVSAARRVVERGKDPHDRLVRVEHKTGPFDVHYYMRVKLRPESRDFTFRLVRTKGGSLRAAWGYFSLRPYGKHTLLAFGVKSDIGDGLLVGMVRRTAQNWLLKVPWLMKRFMEGSGRWIYK